MALRVVPERVFRNGSDAENLNAIALPAQYSPEGSQNLRLTKEGTLETVDGYTSLNSTAIITNGGSSVVKIVGLYHYRSLSGGTKTRRLVAVVDDGANEYEVWHSTDGGSTFSFLKDLGSGAVNLFPSFTQFENTLILVFGGSIAAQTYDGSSVSVAGQTQPSTPSATASGGAGKLNGIYQYKIAFIDANGDVGPASIASTEIVIENENGSVSSIATGAGGTLGRRIFRNTGDGNVFFRLHDIDDNTTTTFTDNVSDKNLLDGTAEVLDVGDAPPSGIRKVVSHRARTFYLTTNALPNSLYYTPVGKPEAVFLEDSLRIGEGEDGDECVGGTPEYEGQLVLWKERSVWLLQGDGRFSWNLIRTQASVGAVDDQAAVQVPAGAKYMTSVGQLAMTDRPVLAYITPNKDIRIFDGANDIIISWPKEETIAGMSYQNRKYSRAVLYPPYNWVVFGFPASGSSEIDTYIAWDYSNGTWHTLSGFPGSRAMVVGDSASVAHILFVGEGDSATGGIAYHFLTGTDMDSGNLTAKFRSAPITGQRPELLKTLRYIDPILKSLGSSLSLAWTVYTDFPSTGASSFSTGTVEMQGTNKNWVNPGPIYPKNSSGQYPLSESFVIEFSVTAKTAWGVAGWVHGLQYRKRENPR